MLNSAGKNVIAFLEELSAKSAVYTPEFELLWSNAEDFYSIINLEKVKALMPIREETVVSVRTEKRSVAISVIPYYKSKRIINLYILITRDADDVYNLIDATGVNEIIKARFEKIKTEISNVERIAKHFRDRVAQRGGSPEDSQILAAQAKSITMATAITDQCMKMFAMPNKSINEKVFCNLSALLDSLCDETDNCLRGVDRKCVFDLDSRSYYSKIHHRLFSLAFVNILSSVLMFSPYGSTIKISSEFEGGLYSVSIESMRVSTRNFSKDEINAFIFSRDMARNITKKCCDAEVDFLDKGDVTIATFKVEAVKKNRGIVLNVRNSEYLSERYRVVESGLVEALLYEQGKNKKI